MKTKTIISDITHEDLVDLFSTATYGSNWLAINLRNPYSEFYEEGDCREDVWARALLAGSSIEVFDYYAEGEHYGDLPYTHDEEDGDCVHYTITLEDIEKGIAEALNIGGYEARCARHLIEQEGDLDLQEAEDLMQVIIFGEIIYG